MTLPFNISKYFVLKFFSISRQSVIFSLVPLSEEEPKVLVEHGLRSVALQHVASLTRNDDLSAVAKLLESLVCLFPRLEGLHIVNFLLTVVGNQVELAITGSHLLNIILSDGVSCCDLRKELCSIGVEVLNDRLLAGLIINNGGTGIGLESHSHGHRGSLGLLRVLHIEFLIFDGVFLEMGIVENYHAHAVLEVFRVLQVDLDTFLA